MNKQQISILLNVQNEIAQYYTNAIKLIDICKKLDGYYISTESVVITDIIAQLKNSYVVNNYSRNYEYNNQIDKYINFYKSQNELLKVTFGHSKGSYTFYTPNEVKYLNLLGIQTIKPIYDRVITINPTILKTAQKYCEVDELRPNKQYVRIEVCRNKYNVIATNFNQLYIKNQFDSTEYRHDIYYIHFKTKVSKVADLQFIDDKVYFNGNEIEQPNLNYPMYKDILPTEDIKPTIVKKDSFIQCINFVKSSCNKYSNRINVNVNGKVTIKNDNIDMGYNAESKFSYIESSLEYDFFVNYKYLLNTLNSIDDDNVNIKYYAKNKPIIIEGSNVKTLVMPMYPF
jgi:hypothetical protein